MTMGRRVGGSAVGLFGDVPALRFDGRPVDIKVKARSDTGLVPPLAAGRTADGAHCYATRLIMGTARAGPRP